MLKGMNFELHAGPRQGGARVHGATWMVPSSESTALWSPAQLVPDVWFAPRFTVPRGMPVLVSKDDIMRSTNSCALRTSLLEHACRACISSRQCCTGMCFAEAETQVGPSEKHRCSALFQEDGVPRQVMCGQQPAHISDHNLK